MIKFGPSGNSESFYNEGHKSTVEAPKWVKERGLDIYEYSFGKGVLMGENTAKLIGAEAQKYDVEITAHAPYFINFANPDDEILKTIRGWIMPKVLIDAASSSRAALSKTLRG